MDFPSNRRQFLSVAGAGTAASIAGCTQFDLSNDGTQDDESGANATVTASVQPAQEDLSELQQRQAQLQQQAQAGEINQSEYEAEMQSLQEDQMELIDESMNEFESYAADADGLEIVDSADGTGLFLLESPPESLVETLTDEAVRGLLPEHVFEEAQQSQSP